MFLTKNSTIPFEVKSDAAPGVIEGYLSVFDVVDLANDIVERGAFVDSLAEGQRAGRKFKMLYQHQPDKVIGLWDDLAEDKRGLWVRGHLLVDESPKAREVHGLIKAGALDSLSIGYRVRDEGPKEGKPGVNSLKKLQLIEGSVVTFPANERARIDTVKMLVTAGKMPTVREFEELLREAGFSKSKSAVMAGACAPHLRGEPEGQATAAVDFLRQVGLV